MNNLKNILLITAENAHRAVFVSAREEGGINVVYDPDLDQEIYQVFIHNRFPYEDIESKEFPSFEEARTYAAQRFDDESWDLLLWNMKTNRPCEGGEGKSCGSGSCTSGNCGGNGKKESTDGSSGCSTC